MGVWSRMLLFLKVKTSAALDRVEDPIQVVEYALEQQQAVLRKVRLGLVEVTTSRCQLEQQAEKQRAKVPQMEDQARRALLAGREDLARIALERKQTALAEMERMGGQLAEVSEQERRLSASERQLTARVEEFRTRREVIIAAYNAAEAQLRVNEALSGVSGELAELSMAVGRAEEKTERMRARASAIDALISTGDLPAAGGDLVERELRRIAATQAIDDDMAALKAQLVLPQPRPALDGGAGATGRDPC